MTWVTVGVSVGSALLGARSAKRNEKKGAAMQAGAEGSEADRQTQLDVTRSQIDRTFDSPMRQKQYADYAEALRGYYGDQLGRKKRDTARNMKFALAGSGLTGGSVAADQSARLGDEFSRAAISNEQRVQGAEAGLRSADEASRLKMHELAMGGMGATTGLRRSAESLAGNLQTQTSNAQMQGIGDVFADTTSTYRGIQERAAQRRGYGYAGNRKDVYGD